MVQPVDPFNPGDIPTDDCSDPIHPLARLGIELFNQAKYFEAHEELELAWREEAGPIRELYRGILQVAVAYYHLLKGNYPGARKMFLRSRRWLQPFPGVCRGVDVDALRRDASQIEELLLRLGPDHIQDILPEMLKPVVLT